MQRIFFLFPNLCHTKKAEQRLLNMGLTHDQIKVLTKNDMGLDHFSYHKYPRSAFTELLPSMLKGATMGFILGAVFLMAYLYFNPEGMLSVPLGLFWMFMSVLIGAWFASLVGISIVKPNHQALINAIESGKGCLVIEGNHIQQAKMLQKEKDIDIDSMQMA